MPRAPLTPLTAYRSSGVVRQEPLLTTKLYVPQVRPNLVPRPRLTAQLSHGLNGKLILIAAPAGFGKTTLLSEWIEQKEWPASWVSLDEGDNDPARFVIYVSAALQTIRGGIEDILMTLLSSPEQPSDETVLTTLLNEAANIPEHFIFVLDDYHVIENDRIHNGVAFLLDHMPPQMHMVISSRTEPPIPLTRLRVRGQLVELRAPDLRFTLDEVASFLNEIMGLGLSATDVAALEARTEGWVASLQLAALSMQGRDDVHDFVREFTGDNRYVLDYLAEEVLHRQPESLQVFLVQTAILDRLSAPLCNAVTGKNNAQTMLDKLETANLVIPLDDKRRWYRYHHLFADFLRGRLKETYPDRAWELHRRAAEWYEQNNLLADAVNHILAIGDYEGAARLIEQVGKTMLMRAENTTLLTWMKALPDSLVRTRPRLCLLHAWALAIANQSDIAEARLKDAERELGVSQDTSSTVLRRSSFVPGQTKDLDEIFGEVVALRTILALRKESDIPRIIRLSHLALDRLPEDSFFLRGVINLSLAGAYWLSGDIAQALEHYKMSAAISESGGSLYIAMFAIGNLGDLQTTLGELHEAYDTYQRFLRLATRPDGSRMSTAWWAYFGIGTILYEWNDLNTAEQYLTEGIRLIEEDESDERIASGTGYVCLAQLKLAQGNISEALALLEEAEHVARRFNDSQRLAEISNLRARIWIEQGNMTAAEHWTQEIEVDTQHPRDEKWLSASLILARIRFAQGDYDEALEVTEQILQAVDRVSSRVMGLSALVLKTIILQTKNNTDEALHALHQALELGESGGYIRIFVDEAAPISTVLRHLAARGIMPSYINRLLAAFDEAASPSRSTRSIDQPLTEPLSDRELDVLQRIAEGLSNREIAEQLYVAVSTVKTHINNIYSKLEVNSRTQALARARELKLLD